MPSVIHEKVSMGKNIFSMKKMFEERGWSLFTTTDQDLYKSALEQFFFPIKLMHIFLISMSIEEYQILF